MPDGVEGLSGQSLTGFAHGTAGIAYFLAEYSNRFERREVAVALSNATEWLLTHAIRARDSDGLEWPLSLSDRHRWRWWCHGAPGIALTFLKLYEHAGEQRFAEIARGALSANRPDVRYANLSQCHGLSGLGEIYLEASRVLDDRYWFEQARLIAEDLLSLARQDRDRSLTWLV
jgi:lantibiotic modifying enzyme